MYSSYVPAKQAGVNIRFADVRVGMPDAQVYLMPSISGNFVLPAQNYYDLRKRNLKYTSFVILRFSVFFGRYTHMFFKAMAE